MIRRQSAALLTAVKAEQRSKDAPRSDKVSQTEAKTKLFLVLFVLYREDFSLMSGRGPYFSTLPIMRSHNAYNRCHV
ncbi:MAG: hypothetical protein AUI36_42900 [Cyanobacteria bacterium 13_1_40CM_2_61_4]|nr:MAG: hypothetical protein AUI36_42900 [Cyanobacteria bacterium 13_1_40CM_2_61_4]